MRLDSTLSLELFQEMDAFDLVYESVRSGRGVEGVAFDPAVSVDVEEGGGVTGVMCDGSVSHGGSVAAALVKVALMDTQLVCACIHMMFGHVR